ncbi:MAG: BlaI/MecI/CopY family transcriptional regulator [Lachnospiraceae bacterium]
MDECRLSDSELLVMKVIWKSEESLSLQDIAERVNRVYGKNWKPQTVSVFLGRIVKKNLLKSKRQGRQFYYYPTITEEEYRKREAVKCVEFLGDGRADVFFASLSKARSLTEEEKERIRGILNELD